MYSYLGNVHDKQFDDKQGGPNIQEGWVELKICRYFICKLSSKFLKLSMS